MYKTIVINPSEMFQSFLHLQKKNRADNRSDAIDASAMADELKSAPQQEGQP